MTASLTNEQIEQQAAQWVMRRDRDGYSERDMAELEAWLARDARHRRAYLECDEAWELTAGLNQWNPRDGAVDPDLLAPRQPSRWSRAARSPWAMAASLLVAAGLIALTQLPPMGSQSYSTPVGGYERVILADGSTLQLNTDTEVETHFTEERREIKVLRGEAFFDVARDARRPFEVRVGDNIARAVGTAFSVRVGPDNELELMVTQGRVLLMPKGQQTQPTVDEGRMVRTEPNRVAVVPVTSTEISRRLAWQTGQLMFDRQPLSEVVEEFNRYNHRRIRLASASLHDLKMTGNFRSADLESFIAAVRNITPVAVEHGDEEIVIRAGI